MTNLPVTLAAESARPVVLRRATVGDVAAIVALLIDDPLGSSREASARGEDLAPYVAAFEAIDSDPNQLLVVAVDGAGGRASDSYSDSESDRDSDSDRVVATLQLTYIPGLSRRGALRAQIEAVRVASGRRGEGLGARLIQWAVGQAKERGCAVVQLTTDKSRTDAHRFYDRLGFVASHEGYKLTI